MQDQYDISKSQTKVATRLRKMRILIGQSVLESLVTDMGSSAATDDEAGSRI